MEDTVGVVVVSTTKRVLRRLIGLPAEGTSSGKSSTAPSGDGTSDNRSDNPWFRTQGPALAASGVRPAAATSASERELWPRIRRVLLTALIVFLLFVGAYTVFVKPFVNRAGSDAITPTSNGVSAEIAQAAAAKFVLDYLSFSPANDPVVRAAALAGETTGTDAAAMAWTGSGYISATDALAGAVVQYPGGRAVVMVDVRVSVAAPKKGAPAAKPPAATTPAAPASAVGQLAAPAGPAPAGYSTIRSIWLRLAVPVSQSEGGEVLVSPTGPVFTGDGAGPDGATAGDSNADAAATADSTKWIPTFMSAYAASAADYQTAPGAQLAGLGGAVTASDVTSWSLSAPDAAGGRVGSASVTWQIPGVELAITQTYSVSVSQQAGRWYASALGPKLGAPIAGGG